jgi:betaine-aldehyde dehydrogenase
MATAHESARLVTHPAQLAQALDLQRRAYAAEPDPPRAVRRERLARLRRMLREHAAAIRDAIAADFGMRAAEETELLEQFTCLEGIAHARRHLRRWMRTERRPVAWWSLPGRARLMRQPLGVVGIIVPWNYPLFLAVSPLTAALAAGNRAMLKMSEHTPRFGALFESLVARSFRTDEVTVVNGDASVAKAFAALPFDHLLFTGSTGVGREVMKAASAHLTPVTLELGGKSPTIVFEDADLDHAVNGVLYGIFSSSGESCIAGSRLFVHESVRAPFLERLVAKASALRVGDPEDPRTQMGPLITAKHRESIERYVKLGLDEGGRLLAGGERPKGGVFERGWFYRPTVLDGLSNRARIAQEEIFGPVLVTMPFRDESELLAQANDSVFGLAAGIWTRDYKRAWRVARALETGTVWINTYKQFSISTPFSGIKDSGVGVEKGRLGILQYKHQKSLYWGLNEHPLPWAG